MNFYANSKRSLTPDAAAAIRNVVPDPVELVGVFVNHSPEAAVDCVRRCGLTAAQFHGDESADDLKSFHELSSTTKIVLAVRIDPANIAAARRRVLTAAEAVPLAAVLLDTWSPDDYGGTGLRTAPETLTSVLRELPDLRWIAAGGLTPENVADVVATLQPWGVDTASGVEDGAGIKNHRLMEQFLAAAGSGSDRL